MGRACNPIDRTSYTITMLESGSFDIYQKHLINTDRRINSSTLRH